MVESRFLPVRFQVEIGILNQVRGAPYQFLFRR